MLTVTALPAFEDNYIWVLHTGCHAIAVDPGDPAPLLAFLDARQLALGAILITHHHLDHTGGNTLLRQRYNCAIYGPGNPRIPAVTHRVRENDTLNFPELELSLSVIDTPGHTLDHVSYYGANHLFCGDTVFGCGCGKLFEGTPEMMADSLDKILALPDSIRICCAHEYTLSNIEYAKTLDPQNPALLERERAAISLRKRGLPTLPSTLALEKSTNPFLRFHSASMKNLAAHYLGHEPDNAAQVFGAIRAAKDAWDGVAWDGVAS